MKSVCIVGAGPAGLAGAKALLQTKRFKVTIFEKDHRIGGIWAVDENSRHGFLSPYTPTNISRFTVGFSDLDWNSVDFRRGNDGEGEPANVHVPVFPFAWQVNRYLEEFRKRYVPQETIHLGTEVIKAERLSVGAGQDKVMWKVTSRNEASQKTKVDGFDYLIVAAGFFSSPRPTNFGIIASERSKNVVRMLHTSQFRTLRDLVPDLEALQCHGRDKKKNILIFGGGNSSGETAATLALQLSDLKYSPRTKPGIRDPEVDIIHVTPRPLYAVPPFNPVDDDCRAFLPLDLKFYDLSKRPGEGPIVSNAGRVSRGIKDVLHSAVQAMVGGDQSDLGSEALIVPSGEPRSPVYATLSETYSEFVRSGTIRVIPGRVVAVGDSAADDGDCEVTVIGSDERELTVDGVVAIIRATGYTASSAVEFLDAKVKETLQYDSNAARLPLILSGYQTYSPDIPDLAFLGFYESPYWTMIEMQADLTVARWMNNSPILSPDFEQPENLLSLREAMMRGESDVPQYWFGDHLGYIEEAATHLRRTRFDGNFAPREGPVPSARYRSPYTNTEEADGIMSELYVTWHTCTSEGRYVARAAFRALQGKWTMRRVILSALPSFPSGTLDGTAAFHPRRPTADKSGKQFDFEYLYIESGTLVLSNGASMPASRRYVYRYSEARDELSVWFVKPDSDLEVDYLFHDLQFVTPDEARNAGACVAKADHLCVQDMYWTEYRLPIKGVGLLEFEAKHTVKGPDKDYVTTTSYRRPETRM